DDRELPDRDPLRRGDDVVEPELLERSDRAPAVRHVALRETQAPSPPLVHPQLAVDLEPGLAVRDRRLEADLLEVRADERAAQPAGRQPQVRGEVDPAELRA